MPTYDYRCTVCGRQIEVVHGIYESGPSACASCGAAMRKAVSPPAIHFRGGGWAKKDARSASAAKAGSGSSSTTAAADPTSGASDGSASDGSPKERSGKAAAGSDGGSTATSSERAATKTANSSE